MIGEQDVTPYNQYYSHTLSILQCYKVTILCFKFFTLLLLVTTVMPANTQP